MKSPYTPLSSSELEKPYDSFIRNYLISEAIDGDKDTAFGSIRYSLYSRTITEELLERSINTVDLDLLDKDPSFITISGTIFCFVDKETQHTQYISPLNYYYALTSILKESFFLDSYDKKEKTANYKNKNLDILYRKSHRDFFSVLAKEQDSISNADCFYIYRSIMKELSLFIHMNLTHKEVEEKINNYRNNEKEEQQEALFDKRMMAEIRKELGISNKPHPFLIDDIVSETIQKAAQKHQATSHLRVTQGFAGYNDRRYLLIAHIKKIIETTMRVFAGA